MTWSGIKSIEQLFFKLALLGGGLVMAFSILNGYKILAVTFRTAFSFILIYFLGQSLIKLWIKLSPLPKTPVDNYRSTIDYLLGDESGKGQEIEQKQQNVPIAGQINPDMQNRLKNENTKAELVKKMGFQQK